MSTGISKKQRRKDKLPQTCPSCGAVVTPENDHLVRVYTDIDGRIKYGECEVKL